MPFVRISLNFLSFSVHLLFYKISSEPVIQLIPFLSEVSGLLSTPDTMLTTPVWQTNFIP